MSEELHVLLFTALPAVQDLLLLLLFVRALLMSAEREKDPEARLVSLSPVLLWTGVICGGILSVPVTLLAPDTTKGVWYFFEAVILGCLAMLLAYCNETVRYDEAQFETRSFLGRKHSWSYREITGLSRKQQDVYLHCGSKKIRLDAMAQGREDFLAHAERMYKAQYSRGIPRATRKRRDPMNGNLDTPWLYLIIYLFIALFSAALLFLPVYVLQPAGDTPPADAFEIRTSFTSWKQTREDQGTLKLFAPGEEKPFTVSWLDGLETPLPDSDTLCSGETYTLTVREGEEEYWIYAIRDRENQPILSVRDRNNAYRNSQRIYCVFLELFAAAGLFVGIFGILVGRHPESYSHSFRKLFYRDWAWVCASGRYHHDKSNQHRRR